MPQCIMLGTGGARWKAPKGPKGTTFKALPCEGQVHAHLSWQARQEIGRSNVHKQPNATFWHSKHGPARMSQALGHVYTIAGVVHTMANPDCYVQDPRDKMSSVLPYRLRGS